jgi:hypothetical protein
MNTRLLVPFFASSRRMMTVSMDTPRVIISVSAASTYGTDLQSELTRYTVYAQGAIFDVLGLHLKASS